MYYLVKLKKRLVNKGFNSFNCEMSNPKGNPGNSGGKKGISGRKSAYEELKNAKDTQAMFFNAVNQDDIEARIRSGTFSVFDRYLLTALEGDTKILESLSKKVLPDKIDMKGDITISDFLKSLDEEDKGQSLEIKSPLQDQE